MDFCSSIIILFQWYISRFYVDYAIDIYVYMGSNPADSFCFLSDMWSWSNCFLFSHWCTYKQQDNHKLCYWVNCHIYLLLLFWKDWRSLNEWLLDLVCDWWYAWTHSAYYSCIKKWTHASTFSICVYHGYLNCKQRDWSGNNIAEILLTVFYMRLC